MTATFYTHTHLIVRDGATVKVDPSAARLSIDGEGWHALTLTLKDVPSVDQLMAGLAEVRDALTRPAGTAAPAHRVPATIGGEL